MLDSFRSIANSWLAKLLLLLLILSFAVWGIGDMLRGGGRNQAVATVGGSDIAVREFDRDLRAETENIRAMLGGNDSPELLKSLQLPQRTLQRMVNERLLQLESESLGLAPDDAAVAAQIRSDRMFADENGAFDKRRFEAYLHNMGITERTYVDRMRRQMAAGLLADTLTGAVAAPDIAVETLYATRNEQRAAIIYALTPALVSDVPPPTADQVQAYYKEHAAEFTAPEYRKLSYITLMPADVPSPAISDDELRSVYKERLDEFKRPERRGLEQLLYSDEATAQKAEALLKSGKSFVDTAKEIPPTNKDSLTVGKVARNEIPQDAANAVFALPQGGVSAPIKGPFGWTIYHVTAVLPPSTASFDEVRPQLVKDMQQRNADDALTQLTDKLQDALAGGSTLPEAAKDLHLTVHTLGPVDRQGNAPDGSAVKDVPALAKFLDTAFKTDEKTESALTPAKDGTFYVVRVDSVTPEHLRPLDEVKAQAAAGWQKQERAKRLADLAKTIAAQFGGKTRDAAIAKYNLQPAATASVKRSSQSAGALAVPAPLVADIFRRKPGEGTAAYPLPNGDYAIAIAGAVIPAPPPGKDAKIKGTLDGIRTALETDMQNETLAQYTRYLAEKYPVYVHESVLQSFMK